MVKFTNKLPDNGKKFNISDDPVESIFSHAYPYVKQSEFIDDIQGEMDTAFKEISNIKNDERSTILVGAMFVEMGLESILENFLEYKKHYGSQSRFYPNIRLLRATKLIPSWIIDCADLIRKIRNEFAHSYDIKSFDQISTIRVNEMKRFYEKYCPDDSSTELNIRELYSSIAQFTTMVCYFYASHIELMSKYLRSSVFHKNLEEFSKTL